MQEVHEILVGYENTRGKGKGTTGKGKGKGSWDGRLAAKQQLSDDEPHKGEANGDDSAEKANASDDGAGKNNSDSRRLFFIEDGLTKLQEDVAKIQDSSLKKIEDGLTQLPEEVAKIQDSRLKKIEDGLTQQREDVAKIENLRLNKIEDGLTQLQEDVAKIKDLVDAMLQAVNKISDKENLSSSNGSWNECHGSSVEPVHGNPVAPVPSGEDRTCEYPTPQPRQRQRQELFTQTAYR